MLATAIGCAQVDQQRCGDAVCPVDLACLASESRCVAPVRLTDCLDQADGDSCSYPGVVEGTCQNELCIPAGCGNGVLEEGEVCDDGNRDQGDGCSSECHSSESCGNGVVDAVVGEACDDGNTVDGDGCQANCASPTCGDGVVDAQFNELCDCGSDPDELPASCSQSNGSGSDADCRGNCRPARCGDGIEDFLKGEDCDDGNNLPGDGCSGNCRAEVCGNGVLDVEQVGGNIIAVEECDDGMARDFDRCGNECTLLRNHWDPVVAPPQVAGHAMAYDPYRGRIFIHGGTGQGTDSYLRWWAGQTWTRSGTEGALPARSGHRLVFDTASQQLILIGGRLPSTDQLQAGVWSWNGLRWKQSISSGPSPLPRAYPGVVYDSARGRVILFGGVDESGTTLDDTWAWDGSTWSELTTAGGPAKRQAPAVSYDPVRDRVYLFGGVDGGTLLDDTWEWDGSDWTQVNLPIAAGTAPRPRYQAAMVYDAAAGESLLFGGIGTQTEGDTWTWNGSTWSEVTALTDAPSPRGFHSMAYDTQRAQVVLFGGQDPMVRADTWTWNGSEWNEVSPPSPGARTGHSLVYDLLQGRALLYGGADAALWQWDGIAWEQLNSAGDFQPGALSHHAMEYDQESGTAVLFGGIDSSGVLEFRTYLFDGNNWVGTTPFTSNPSRRAGHAMAYDIARGRVLLFGGETSDNEFLNDTFEWNRDTVRWDLKTTTGAVPSARRDHALAYDASRQRIVLFGGRQGGSLLSDTWEWDGTSWLEVAPVGEVPVPRAGHTLFYDAARGRVVLFGGEDEVGLESARIPFAWDGTQWTPIRGSAVDAPPTGRSFHAMVYDVARGEALLFGGEDSSQSLSDTWRQGFRAVGAEQCHTGLDGDGDGKLGCEDPDCFGWCWPQCWPGTETNWPANCAVDTPRCGDGNCDASLESCFSCPGDCGLCAAVCGDFICDAMGGETAADCPGDCGPP